MHLKILRVVVTLAAILALLVIMLGAYTRLTDAGLGCPDWPGCYGKMIVPGKGELSLRAQQVFSHFPLEAPKAWTEMIHRYCAGILAMLVFFIGGYVLWQRCKGIKIFWVIPATLMGLVVLQALLGMWTVTMQLLPLVVMGHLLGGILIFSCLCLFRLQISPIVPLTLTKWSIWVGLGGMIVFCQIALGGWVSANYAGIACVGFPQCNGQWLPDLHFLKAFNLFLPLGKNYQGGLLDQEVRITIQILHRIGAIITTIYLLSLLIICMIQIKDRIVRCCACITGILLCVQFLLGVINVLYILPLSIAVAHNGFAALLFTIILLLFYLTRGRPTHAF